MSTSAVILPGPKVTGECLPEGRRVSVFNLFGLPGQPIDPFANQNGQAILSQIGSLFLQITSALYDVTGQNLIGDAGWIYTVSDGAFQNFQFVTPTTPAFDSSGSPSTLGQALITACIPMYLLPGQKISISVTNIQGGSGNLSAGNGNVTLLAYNEVLNPFLHVDIFGFTD
jgi:hypothetical protein